MKPYYQDNYVTIYHGDCREILPQLPDNSVDLVLTDPPYPSQHPEYGDCDINFLEGWDCRQLIFWSAHDRFPLAYAAFHIWDKQISSTGSAAPFEMIYERNGSYKYQIFRSYLINSTVAANYTRDIFTGHPSQKPRRLIEKLIIYASKNNDLILDPFLGSGTTACCAKKLNRKCIGIEIEEKYCEIAANRCRQSVMELMV